MYGTIARVKVDPYRTNAQSPEQNERYQELRALLLAEPEWHDGEIIDVVQRM